MELIIIKQFDSLCLVKLLDSWHIFSVAKATLQSQMSVCLSVTETPQNQAYLSSLAYVIYHPSCISHISHHTPASQNHEYRPSCPSAFMPIRHYGLTCAYQPFDLNSRLLSLSACWMILQIHPWIEVWQELFAIFFAHLIYQLIQKLTFIVSSLSHIWISNVFSLNPSLVGIFCSLRHKLNCLYIPFYYWFYQVQWRWTILGSITLMSAVKQKHQYTMSWGITSSQNAKLIYIKR